MPNGGSDHCGNCRHNVPKVDGVATYAQRRDSAFCTVRNVSVRTVAGSGTVYCANHYLDDKTSVGPMFQSWGDHERIPYHGYGVNNPHGCTTSACALCGAPSKQEERGVEVVDEKLGVLQFCGTRHYVRWWKQVHPGVSLKWDVDAPPQESGNSAHDDAQAKLELADAYLAMSDRNGARDVLGDVLRIGSSAQQSRAREMLKRC